MASPRLSSARIYTYVRQLTPNPLSLSAIRYSLRAVSRLFSLSLSLSLSSTSSALFSRLSFSCFIPFIRAVAFLLFLLIFSPVSHSPRLSLAARTRFRPLYTLIYHRLLIKWTVRKKRCTLRKFELDVVLDGCRYWGVNIYLKIY